MDDVQVYVPKEKKLTQPFERYQVGDRFPAIDRPRPTALPSVLLFPNQPRMVVYVRLQTTSTMVLQPRVLSLNAAIREEGGHDIAFGLSLGVLVCLWLWGSYRFILERDHLLGLFALYQFLVAWMTAVRNGYWAVYVWPYASQGTDVLYSGLLLFASWLWVEIHRQFLLTLPVNRWAQKALSLIGVLMLLNAGQYARGWRVHALHTNVILGTLAVPLVLFVGWQAYRYAHKQVRFPLVSYGLVLLLVSLGLFTRLGLLDFLQWPAHFISPQILLANALVVLLLQFRSDTLEVKRQETLVALELSQQEARLAHEQREQQSRFMAMLTHELKSPLAVIRMAVGNRQARETGRLRPEALARIDLAASEMNRLIERCSQADAFMQGKMQPRWAQFNPLTALEDCLRVLRDASRVQFEAPSDLVWHSDLLLCQTIMSNLLDNALKYSPPDSLVFARLGCDVSRNKWYLQVQNQIGAAGIPAPERIFEKYYRAPGAQAQRGTGLGLWLTKALVEQLGGILEYQVQDHPALAAQQTTAFQEIIFTVWFPV